jgi:hypothetical protein
VSVRTTAFEAAAAELADAHQSPSSGRPGRFPPVPRGAVRTSTMSVALEDVPGDPRKIALTADRDGHTAPA